MTSSQLEAEIEVVEDEHANKTDESDDMESTKKRKTMKTRADVWNHFSKYKHKGVQMCKCNYCPKSYKHAPSLHGTSTLRAHMIRCSRSPLNKKKNVVDARQTTLNAIPTFGTSGVESTLAKWTFKYDNARKGLAYMIVVDELPFKFVENQGFKYFVSQLTDKFNVPSRMTVSRDCYELFVEQRLKLKSFLKCNCRRVCLTTDTWTSLQKNNYMCLTAHFIDEDWILNKRILNFCPISSHKGDAIGKAVEKCLLNWDIDNVMTITVDNASSNDTAIKYLKKKLKDKQVILKGDFLHMRCVAHIMNLIVHDGLKFVDKSVRRVRNAIRYVKQSPRRLDLFKKCVEEEKIEYGGLLSLDVSTRWNSTYLMLDTALKFQNAFDRFNDIDPLFSKELKELLNEEKERVEEECEVDEGGKPSDSDWEKVKDLSLMLRSFYDLTVRVSGSSYVTSNCAFQEIFNVNCHLNNYCNGADYNLSLMAGKMKQKWDKYWGNPEKLNVMIFIAAILDPRNKLQFVNFGIEKMYNDKAGNVKKNVERVLNKLFDEYKMSEKDNVEGSTGDHSSSSQCRGNSKDQQPVEDLSRLLFYKEMAIETGDNRSELDRYINEDCEPYTLNFDILGWWKGNCSKYPILSLVARDVLAIPITTVASESAFSTGGRVLDAFRSSLSPKIVESLICTGDWLRAPCMSKNVEEQLETIEQLEKEIAGINLAPPVIDVL